MIGRSAIAATAALLLFACDLPAAPGPGAARPPSPDGMSHAANLDPSGPAKAGKVALTVDRPAGVYAEPITVTVTGPGPLCYTLDGREPGPDTGRTGASPLVLTIERTTVVRVATPGSAKLPVLTRTYLLPSATATQHEAAGDLPTPALSVGGGVKMELDFHVDPAAAAGTGLDEALTAIPSVSLALDPHALLGADGILLAGGAVDKADFEHPVSVELIDPAHPEATVQIDAALRPHSWASAKRSFKLLFKGEYGASALESTILQDAPGADPHTASRFDRLILRAGTNRSWARQQNPDRTTYVRDQLARDLQLAISGYGARGTFVHLYLNGLYWGLYDLVERPDHRHAAEYFGGDDDDFFAISHGGAISGDSTRWDQLFDDILTRQPTEPGQLDLVSSYVDLSSFIDYVVLNFFLGTSDWPFNNWYAVSRTSPPGPLRFVVWDAEETLDDNWGHDGAWVHPHFSTAGKDDQPITALWHHLRQHPEFMMKLADRVHALTSGTAPLSQPMVQERWLDLHDQIDAAIAAEAARWGDQLTPLDGATRTRETTFFPERDRVLNGALTDNTPRLIAALRAEGYYPDLDPPQVTFQGASPTLTHPNSEGDVYMTLDGTDPRLPGGALSRVAITADTPPTPPPTTIRARVRTADGNWSALTMAITP